MLHFMVSPHSRMCSVTTAKDTLQRQLSIVVAAFCLANEWKAGGGLRTWSLSSNLVRFIADCLHLEGGLSLPVLHGAAQGQAQTPSSVQALAKSSSGASEPLPLQNIVRLGGVLFSTIESLPGAHP